MRGKLNNGIKHVVAHVVPNVAGKTNIISSVISEDTKVKD